MDFAKLRHILAVAETGSFSRAAETQNITQPALSRSIAAFERRHGVRLFDRGRGGVVPTSGGALVIEQARALLGTAQELERSLSLYGKGEAGRVALGLGPLMASMLLPQLGQTLLRARPYLQIFTVIKPPEQLIGELMSDAIEIVIGNGLSFGEMPGLVTEPLGKLEMAVIVRSDHPLAKQGTVTQIELEAFPVAQGAGMPGEVSRTRGAFVCDNFHILRETVLQTDCISICAKAFLAEDLRQGRITVLNVKELRQLYNMICVIHKYGRTMSPSATAVVELARETLQGSI